MSNQQPLRVVVAGHDLKFAQPLIERWRNAEDLEVRTDHWIGFSRHDESASREMIDWGDVVLCEWCGPNAEWYSRHRRPGQRLIVRLHRFELTTDSPKRLAPGAVDAIVTVSEHYRRLVASSVPTIEEHRVVTIPNGLDTGEFDRPKIDEARYQLGMIGAVPQRKRIDRALDILERVRREDPRFLLLVKSHLPWDLAWIWNRPSERAFFESVLRRIQTSALLADSVVFEPSAPDIPVWLSTVGAVLSTSDDESFHMSPLEGMASGAVPVVLDWPAASSVYDRRWISNTVEEAAARILELGDVKTWNTRRTAAKTEAQKFDFDVIMTSWIALLHGSHEALRPDDTRTTGRQRGTLS